MERNLYFENYINNIQKDIFLFAYLNNYDIVSFINIFMRSYVRKEIDKPYSNWHNQTSRRIFEEAIEETKFSSKVNKQVVNIDAVEWLGYFYSKWHFLTGESSKVIVRYLPPIEGLKQYYVLHQLDEADAIERCRRLYNLKRNNHRKNEYKKGLKLFNDKHDPIYYSFLAVKILSKLNKSDVFKSLKYVGDINGYDFVNDSLMMKVDIISNDIDIVNHYKEIDETFEKHPQTSIYFCFALTSNVNIEEIRNKFPLYKRHFDYLYFYNSGKLYEINKANEIYGYIVPFSYREQSGIINKMKQLGLMGA